jgi:hypothetical protein
MPIRFRRCSELAWNTTRLELAATLLDRFKPRLHCRELLALLLDDRRRRLGEEALVAQLALEAADLSFELALFLLELGLLLFEVDDAGRVRRVLTAAWNTYTPSVGIY